MENSYLYEAHNSLPPDLCIEIINLFNKSINDQYDGVIYSGLNNNVKKTKDITIFSKNNNSKLDFYYKILDKELTYQVNKYVNSLNNYDNSSGYNNNGQKTESAPYIFFNRHLSNKIFLIQKYNKGDGRFIYHEDFSAEKDKYRVITFLWYLNTVKEGGETEFWGNYKVKPERGKLILFPALWTYPHCGKIPLSDDKYIITGWIYTKN
jgi:hypothetical protein